MPEFPDIASKLSAPAKVSQFEKQRAEAEAKKAREKAETLAALAEFERSFDGEDGRPALPSQRGAPAPGKRHFTNAGMKSGPGSLPRSGPGSLGPSYNNKKRPFDDYTDRREKGNAFGRKTSRDEDEKEDEKAAKPTLHLASMPPGSSHTTIKGLFANTPLNIDNVRILPPVALGSQTERKSSSAIVTLAAETSATDIDTVVSHMQNKYLGFGFKLSISRHLSSAAIGNTAISSSSANAFPFGAKQIQQQTSLSRAPPPHQRFAPPQSYTSSTPYSSRGPPSQVTVQPPTDLRQLKLIHKTLESLLTYGPEFEALLMSRPEIQRDEKWSWLWDSSSIGGVYYRWRLWEVLTNALSRRKVRAGHETLFEGQSSWLPPDQSLRFEYTTQLDEFVSDEDYNSSDEESDDGRGNDLSRRYNDHNTPGPSLTNLDDAANNGIGYLDPLAKAKLTHLLSRLPDSTSKLRRGDVARITAFAIEHAGAGGEEVAQLIARNVLRPFCKQWTETEDWTSAAQVGLYVISDLLSSSASAGVRHAWRYRTLFEAALRQQRVFERLGRAEKDLGWGKLKGEKWKRSVQSLLSLWEGWSVFPQGSQEGFVRVFVEPPLTAEEERERVAVEAEAQTRAEGEARRAKAMNRWKSVAEKEEAGGSKMETEDLDGRPIVDDDDEDMTSGLENIDGVSMVDSSDEEMEVRTEPEPGPEAQLEPEMKIKGLAKALEQKPVEVAARPAALVSISTKASTPLAVSGVRRRRPKAADMFADDSS